MWGTTGLGFDAEKLRKRMPDAPLDSWRLLLDPKVVAKFADCGVAVLDSPTDVVAAALQYLGKDPNSESPDDLKVAEAALMAIRPHIRYVNSQRYIEDLANGEICLALGYSGDILQARNRARDAGKTHSVTFLNPKEGGQIWFDTLAIPADAPHPGNAHRLIDYLMRPEVAAKNAAFLRYGSGVGSAAALQPPEVRDDPGINPPPEVRERLVSLLAKSPQYTQLLTRSWTRFRTGR
jgi:putrescine transport system substrate-binding protein